MTGAPTVRLLWLVAPLGVWAAHFAGSYALVALGCPRLAPGAVYAALGALAVAALGGLGALGAAGWRRARGPHDDASGDAQARRAFLGTLTVASAALGAVGVVYAAASAWLVGGCP